MHLKTVTVASLLVCAGALAFAAEPAAVTTYEESHPHAEYNLTYAADKDTHSADADKVVIRKGVCIWFKAAPGKQGTQEARLENGTLHTVDVAEFYKVSAAPPATQPAEGKAAE